MKKIRSYTIPVLSLSIVLLFFGCSEKEDYSNLVYKNYFSYEINRAEEFLGTCDEGTNEGEYQSGSKQVYQDIIDGAKLVDENSSASQKEIDDSYTTLLKAADDFADKMVPFRSAFQAWIDYANHIMANTQEGDQDGDVKPGNKEVLQEAIDVANQTISSMGLTQGQLEQATTDLTDAIYYFNGEIIGKAHILVVNPGFEIPAYDTEDFSLVDGWNLFGKAEDWAPKASVSANETAPEGEYIARIGSYTQGIYQNTLELINPNSTYTLNFKVSLQSNESDWQGNKFPAILLSRIIVFEEGEGDYNFITVLSESYDTLGIEPTDFIEINQSISIDAISASIGKKVAFDFIQKHTWDAANPIWAESFVALDDLHFYRKY